MEDIFKKIGYTLQSESSSDCNKPITLLVVNNNDGTPRWICNANQSSPLFLKFYNAGSFRANIFQSIISSIFMFRLHKIVFKKRKYFYNKSEKAFFDINNQWAIFTGTRGLNNKAVLYVDDYFYKIAMTDNAQRLINNEYQFISDFSAKSQKTILPTASFLYEDILKLSDISSGGVRLKEVNDQFFNTIAEISQSNAKSVNVKDWSFFNNIYNDYKNIDDIRIPKNIVRKLDILLSQIKDESYLDISFSHGDFTQWNMYDKNNKIAVYDWELANEERPKGFDYFHYIIQQGILVDRKNWKSIYNDITKILNTETGEKLFNNDIVELNKYLKWYLIINAMEYLTIYSKSPNWFVQIQWSLQTWTDALNDFLKDSFSQRKLLLMDFFDFLQSKEYATLKFINGHPDGLSLYSDVDMVIDKKLNNEIVSFFNNHSLVANTLQTKKSFMNTLQMITHEDSLLSLDLIWKIKVRNLEILNAKKVLNNYFVNNYGVKHSSNIDVARFIVLFYILNRSSIPQKYIAYQDVIKYSEEPIDMIITEYFDNDNKSRGKLLRFINAKTQNKFLSYANNSISYLFDTISSFFNNKGFIVTFSGVDGAGKSTVIENVSKRLEKQFRKKVVVIRHRPSVLPILSVWTKGKEKAHADATNSLPRQGNNKSLVSSILRFSYYYSDYLFGQFYIYSKYILRGNIVLYDRYYFDFINDGKRSNIVLPKNVTKFGYNFLLKPHYNFFLYADADIILNRKQELTKETIEKLTDEYLTLFKNLSSNNSSSKYEAINNIDLEETLQFIIKTIISSKK